MLAEAEEFLAMLKIEQSKARINNFLLVHAVMDYFTDIARLKSFHPVDYVNKYKIIAYEVFWWLRRKPIQLIDKGEPDTVFINEKFAVSLILSVLDYDARDQSKDAQKYIDSFQDSLYYYFKFRHFTAQDIEMILLAFKAGTYSESLCNED